jgi:hypothetical protein
MALNFPNSPTVGDEFTGGGFTWVWTGSGWDKVAASGGGGGTGFNLLVGASGNTTYVFTEPQPAGSYIISSLVQSDTTFDIYFLNASNQEVGYTNAFSIEASAEFTKVVLYGAVANDIFQFEFKPAASPTSSGGFAGAVGPFLTSISPSALPNQNDTATITGGNFANDVAITFIGQNSVSLPAKNIVRSSSTSLIVTRPDNLAVAQSPYTVRAVNPGTDEPTGSNVNRLSNAVTAGTNPAWSTTALLYSIGAATSVTLLASDTEGSDIDYSIVSGTLPAGLQLDAETGVISGTFSGSANDGDVTTVTFRATDAGGNFADRAITLTANAAPVWTTATNGIPAIPPNQAFSFQLVASGGTAGGALTYTLESGTFPTGITVSSSGLISGTTTQEVAGTVTIRVTDAAGLFTDRTFDVTSILPSQYERIATFEWNGGNLANMSVSFSNVTALYDHIEIRTTVIYNSGDGWMSSTFGSGSISHDFNSTGYSINNSGGRWWYNQDRSVNVFNVNKQLIVNNPGGGTRTMSFRATATQGSAYTHRGYFARSVWSGSITTDVGYNSNWSDRSNYFQSGSSIDVYGIRKP